MRHLLSCGLTCKAIIATCVRSYSEHIHRKTIMIGFAILLKNIRRVEKLKKGSRTYTFFLFALLEKTQSFLAFASHTGCVCVCVCNDLYVKLLNKTNICGEHEGSQEPVIQCVRV